MAVSATALKNKAASAEAEASGCGRRGPAPARSKKGEMEARDAAAVDTRLKALGLIAGQGQEEARWSIRLPAFGAGSRARTS